MRQPPHDSFTTRWGKNLQLFCLGFNDRIREKNRRSAVLQSIQ
jgi:hypothetical protein